MRDEGGSDEEEQEPIYLWSFFSFIPHPFSLLPSISLIP
jgi:hypothetical protein